MKKIKLCITVGLLCAFSLVNVSAKRLVTLTRNTWAENHHADWTDWHYVGELSINGGETYYEGGNKYVPRLIQMTYDVVGNKTTRTVYASGTRTVKESVKVNDSWDPFAKKTKVYYNYSGTRVSSNIEVWGVDDKTDE